MNRNIKWVCVVCIAAFGAVVIEYSLGTEGFAKETSREDAAREPLEASMDLEHLEAIIDELGSDVKGGGGAWQFTFNEVHMVCYTDATHDRMRIMSAIARTEDMTPKQAEEAMDANFHTALDARYATNEGVVYSAFIHPLSPLTDGEARSAIEQVANLSLTFGTTYQSGNLIFGR